ncbi:MAG: hypothetical protein LBO75_03695 [Bifidobacteriaceae bacterium]|jgi:hypothetical protein|nr:hypothetical protein [Bifidobacteriaceae bacterium]
MSQTLTSALAETHHLLALGGDIDGNEIALLASTRWKRVEQALGEIGISRYSSLFGPYSVGAGLGATLGLPRGLNQAWIANTLTERGDPPFPGTLDPTGVSRAFTTGLPVREEGRIVNFLVAVARRLGGVVRFYDSGIMVAPVPDGALDLRVYSPLWLEPEAALVTARTVVPRFQLAIDWHPYVPPPTRPPEVSGIPGWDLTPGQRAELLRQTTLRDAEALAGEQSLDRFALTADLGPAGTLTIEITGVDQTPGALRGVPWASEGAVEYNVRWIPCEPKNLLMEFPPADHCQTRAQMANLLAGIARVIHQTVGGEVLYAYGIPIDPTDL